MITFKYKIKNSSGIHARPAGYLASFAKKCKNCNILMSKDEKSAHYFNVLNVLSTMGAQFKCGDYAFFKIDSKDNPAAENVKKELSKLLEQHF